MIIHIDRLDDGTSRQNWSGEIAGIDLIYPGEVADVQVAASVHRLRDLITVRGQIRARLVRPCDRCLGEAQMALESGLHAVIRRRSVTLPPEEGDEGEYLLTITEEDGEVDLTDQIRDRLVVEVPMAVHCSEECKGLCPRCGADLNQGPCTCPPEENVRWAGLGSIRSES